MIWDHLFGTYQREEEEPSYGVVVPIETYNLLDVQRVGFQRLVQKMKQASNRADAFKCLLYPPEWVPESEPTISQPESRIKVDTQTSPPSRIHR